MASMPELVAALHGTGRRLVLAATGGGAGVAGHLLTVPGGSRTALEVIIPYGEQALAEFLGQEPEQYCSAATAQAMAVRAHARAAWLAPRQPVLGVACTAGLATDRPKKGDHRCHIAVHDGQVIWAVSLTFAKGARDRAGEEAVVDALLLNTLAEAAGIAERLPLALQVGEQVVQDAPTPGRPFPQVGLPVCVTIDGRWHPDAARPTLLVPGSFNPVHAAHWALADVAARHYGAPAAFEISSANVDKPPLAVEELTYRLAQFAWRAPVWLTCAPTFVAKADLFPGAMFAVGCDTAARIIESRYYGNDAGRMTAALQHIRAQGCRFLVAGRVLPDGVFQTCNDLPIPEAFRDLFAAIPENAFRMDVSSTELRQT